MSRIINGLAGLVALLSCALAASPSQANPVPPTVGFSQESWGAVEGAGSIQLSVARTGETSVAASVEYATLSGGAIAGTHFTPVSGTLSWEAGDSTARAIVIPIVDNAVINAKRTFRVALSSPIGVALGRSTALVDILDDDNTVQFTSFGGLVIEGQTATYRVTRTGQAPGPVSVNWSLGPEAIPGVDVTGPTSGMLSWEVGDMSPRDLVFVIPQDDVPEPGKAFLVTLSDPVNAKLGDISFASLDVDDDERSVAFMYSGQSVPEAGATLTFYVSRFGPIASAASVWWSTANGSARAGQDFGIQGSDAQRSGQVSWAAGDGQPKSVTISILQDAVSEGDETFSIVLSRPTNALLGERSSTLVTILDDDITPQSAVAFNTTKLVVHAGMFAGIELTRSSLTSLDLPASVTYSTQSGTALAGSDFQQKTATVTWGPGEAGPKQFRVNVGGDAVPESHEAFKVVLSNPSPGLRIDTPEATLVIVSVAESFPIQAAMPYQWLVPADAAAGWHVSNDPGAYEGAFSLRSDPIYDGEAAQVELTREFGAGDVTFRVRVSSEADFDKLRFFVDGVEMGAWSGTAVPGWQLFVTPLSAGAHTLRWSYEKDGSAAIGFDAAWIDAVTLP